MPNATSPAACSSHAPFTPSVAIRYSLTQRIHWFRRTRPEWQGLSVLILGDILALAAAWFGARYFNQFFSPIPSGLVWWNWLGLPSLFWIFAGAIVFLFAQNSLYSPSPKSQDYLKTGQLISIVYLSSLVVGYFYNPKLNPPRSLSLLGFLV
ncbi:MAG UNVERIFIED_CONTAM: hypothetical protein LVR29_30280 [Microcystis novacekii LVE1205-3]|jgi:hypothetical protein